jgi:hypothetical protein
MIFNWWESTNINKIKSIDKKQIIKWPKEKDIHIKFSIPIDAWIVEKSCVWKQWATLITVWKILSRCSIWWLNVSLKQNNQKKKRLNNQKIKAIYTYDTLSY